MLSLSLLDYLPAWLRVPVKPPALQEGIDIACLNITKQHVKELGLATPY